jgi:hypothetical protein
MAGWKDVVLPKPLALVMLPILLGGVAGGMMLTSYATAGSAAAASVAIPTVPLGIGSGAATAGALGFFGIAGAPLAIVGVVTLAVVVSGAVVIEGTIPDDTATLVSQGEAPRAPGVADSLVGAAGDGLTGDLGGIVGGAASGVVEAVGTVIAATISLDLSGTATAGATVSLQAAGQVYATTTVDRDGNWAIAVAAVPADLASLDLVQQVDRTYLKGLLPGGGVLATVLGTVDGPIDALIRSLRLSGRGAGVAINLHG